jgi:hypothetical protein
MNANVANSTPRQTIPRSVTPANTIEAFTRQKKVLLVVVEEEEEE